MTTLTVQIIHSTATQTVLDAYTPSQGEFVHTTDTNRVYFGDGSTQGGIRIDNAALATRLTALETLTGSSDANLDTLQEVVDFIKANRTTLDSITVAWGSVTGKPAFTDAATTTVAAIRAGTTKANVGLTNVADLTPDQILARVTLVQGRNVGG